VRSTITDKIDKPQLHRRKTENVIERSLLRRWKNTTRTERQNCARRKSQKARKNWFGRELQHRNLENNASLEQ
jgi:hypothetical protein